MSIWMFLFLIYSILIILWLLGAFITAGLIAGYCDKLSFIRKVELVSMSWYSIGRIIAEILKSIEDRPVPLGTQPYKRGDKWVNRE